MQTEKAEQVETQPDGTFTCIVSGEGRGDHKRIVVVWGPSVPFNQNSRHIYTMADARQLRDQLTDMIAVMERMA